MMDHPWYYIALVWLLAAAFLVGGVVNLLGSEGVREDHRRWGYPSGFHLVTGAVQAVAALLILLPAARLAGLALAAAVCVAAAATLVRAREFGHLPPSLVLLALLAVASALG